MTATTLSAFTTLWNKIGVGFDLMSTFGDSHAARTQTMAGILFLGVGAVNLTLGVFDHRTLTLISGLLALVAGILLVTAKKHPRKPPKFLPPEA